MKSNGEVRKGSSLAVNGLGKRRRRNTSLRDSLEEDVKADNQGNRFQDKYNCRDFVIGVPVPRRIRSSSMKRLNRNWSFRKAGFERGLRHHRRFMLSEVSMGRGVDCASPTNGLLRKKMKSVDRKPELPRGVGDSSLVQDDIEIEIVEALFDLKNRSHLGICKSMENEMDAVCTSRNHEEIVTDKKSIEISHLPYKSDLFGRHDGKLEKGMSLSANDGLIGEDDNNMQLKTSLPSKSENVSVGEEKVFNKRGEELFNDSKRIASKKRVVAPQDEEYSLQANQNSDKQVDSILLEGNSAAEVIETKREAKFQIALMDMASDDNKVVGHHIKIADKVVEKDQGETRVEPSYLREGSAKLEKSAMKCIGGKSELVEGRKELNQCKALISGGQKFALPTSLPFPGFSVGWPRGLPDQGYIPPFEIVMPAFPHSPLLSQPRRKRCVTHQYIADNILVHQQLIMNLTTLPATAAPGTIYKAKTSIFDASIMKQIKPDEDESKGEFLGKTMFPALDDKTFASGKNVNAPSNMQQMFQQAFQQIPTASVLAPALQNHAPMMPPSNQIVATLSANSVKGDVGSSSSSPPVSYNHINFSSKMVSPNMGIFPNNGNPFPFSTSSPVKQAPAMMPFVNGSYYSSPTFFVSQTRPQQSHS